MPPHKSMADQNRDIAAFEKDFRDACVKNNISAAFVLVKGNDAKGSMLMIGGSTEVSDFVERCISPNTVEYGERRQ